MTVSNTTTRAIYSGNGSTVDFAIPFSYQNESEVKVVIRDESVSPPTETTKTVVTHYTLTGGTAITLPTTVTFLTAPAATDKVLVIRNVALTQALDLLDSGKLSDDAVEQAIDKSILLNQQLNETLGRCIRVPETSTLTNLELPTTLTANASLVMNATADGIEMGPTTGAIDTAVTDAQAAQAAAEAAQALAETAQTGAEAAETNAEAAQTAAEAAQTAAEAAQAAVESFDTGDFNHTQADTNDWTVADGSTAAAHLDELGARVTDNEADISTNTSDIATQAARSMKLARYQNVQAQGTNGGIVVATAWTQCTLNTEVYDPDGIASVSGNVITINTGGVSKTFLMRAAKPFIGVTDCRIRIRNITDTAYGVGPNVYAKHTGSDGVGGILATAEYYVTFNGTKTFQLEYYAAVNAGATSQGENLNVSGESERYDELTIIEFP